MTEGQHAKIDRKSNMTQDVEKMIQAALRELEAGLDTKQVIGEQITVGQHTIIPLISIGFGFGVGSGSGKAEEIMRGEGTAGASMGAGGMKPIGVIIVGPDGARVESLKGASASLVESLAASVLGSKGKEKAGSE
jgi:uncharacterized spore protein YtfJ